MNNSSPGRCFTWRFPTALCTDAFRFLRALRDNGTGDTRKTTSFHSEAESRLDVLPASSDPVPTEASPVEDNVTKDKGEGDTGDQKRTEGDPGDQEMTDGDTGDQKRTDGDTGDLKGTDGDTGDQKRTDGDTGDLTGPAEEPVSEALIQTDGVGAVSGAGPGGSNQSKEGEEPVEMEEDNGDRKVPGVDASPQNQSSTALDSFIVNAGGIVPPSRPGESSSEQPGAGPAADSPTPSLEDHQDLSDMMHLSLDSPGGMCAAALTLMSLGLLSVHVSIPKEVVLVDNTVGKNDVVKR